MIFHIKKELTLTFQTLEELNEAEQILSERNHENEGDSYQITRDDGSLKIHLFQIEPQHELSRPAEAENGEAKTR